MEAVADQFISYYYQTFDANRATLGPLYVCPSLCLSYSKTLLILVFVTSIFARPFFFFLPRNQGKEVRCLHLRKHEQGL
jgi:hypothetical protein